MSKVGKKPILIPEGITAADDRGILIFKKGNEEVKISVLPYVKVEIKEETDENGKNLRTVNFSTHSGIKQARANWGTIRALTNNIIEGLEKGFKKALEIEGIGYRAMMDGENLVLNIGYSHPVKYNPRKGIKISVEKNVITVAGMDKSLVGQTAAEIRKIKKPEPYKGKGIRYQGEIIRRKAGKKTGTK